MSQIALKHLETIAKSAAERFVKNNAQDVALLGADAVRAIFAAEVEALLEPIPQIDAGMPIELRAEIEGVLERRSRNVQLIAAATNQDAARVAALRASAASVAGGVAKAVVVTVAGLLVRALAG